MFARLLRLLPLAFLLLPHCEAGKKPVTIEAVTSVKARDVGPAIWAPDGKRFVYREAGKLYLWDIPARTSRELISLDVLEKAARRPQAGRAMKWENRRVSEQPIQWASSGRDLLVTASGDLFLLSLDTGKWEQLTSTEGAERDPKLAPDGEKVAFRREKDLYVLRLSDKHVTRLTHDGSATTWNGQVDWVYPEELDLGRAFWWSPDSSRIAYLQFDVAKEMVYPHSDVTKIQPVFEPQRYPKAGTPNAEVRLGVVSASGGSTQWTDLGKNEDSLVARVHWAPDSKSVWVQKLNRVQNELELLSGDPQTGASRVILREADPYWINVTNDFRFLSDGFLWTSERSGFRHIYRYSMSGQLRGQLTQGDWEVSEITGVDEPRGKVYYTSTEESPLERHLYVVGLDGTGKRRLTAAAGTHSISMGPQAHYYLDTHCSLNQPERSVLYQADATEWAVFREADRAADEYEILPTEIVTVKTPDGATLYARLIRPKGFEAGRKYPAIVFVYGGPHAQAVRNCWTGLKWEQALAHKGFVVWQVDNRGSAGRGHLWESKLYRRFGKQELEDQQAGIRHLLSMGFVDPQRLGIYGWSYGGYMTLYALLNAPDLFRAGVAGAPVTDWRNYDTIYTERYLGLPSDNEEGYRLSSPVHQAANLKAKLMIVQNFEDDNVLFANTLQMTDALQRAGKQFELMLYPQKAHAVTGPVQRQMLEGMTDFFERTLKHAERNQ